MERGYAAQQCDLIHYCEMGCETVDNQSQNRVYVTMMVDTLKKKEQILRSLLKRTREQEALLRSEDLDQDEFSATIEAKGTEIDELNEIDEGFDALFKSVKQEITSNRNAYRSQIVEMQSLISEISDLGVEIQALEKQNSERFKMYLSDKRKEIHDFHVNSRTAANYYQNMANVHTADKTYFFDKHK